ALQAERHLRSVERPIVAGGDGRIDEVIRGVVEVLRLLDVRLRKQGLECAQVLVVRSAVVRSRVTDARDTVMELEGSNSGRQLLETSEIRAEHVERRRLGRLRRPCELYQRQHEHCLVTT